MKKKILIAIAVVLVGIQFVPVDLPENSDDMSNDLIANNAIPEHIVQMLKTSCYDCHSNQTEYRWYAHVAPTKFLVAHDVEEGREHLNFSEWESMSKIDRAEALDELAEEVEEGEMPMKIYFVTHPGAVLSDEQRSQLEEWAENFAEEMFE